jgi:hypothetical protein
MKEMTDLEKYYNKFNEDKRLLRRHGNVEYVTSMKYIHDYLSEDKNTKILDIGAGTTDIVMIRDTELVLDSKDTFNIGGNTVEAQLKKLIRLKYGYAPTDISSVVESGYLMDGSAQHDVSELVTSAKDTYSKMLMTHIRSYLERMMIGMREVKGILVAGGGSLPSTRDGKVVSPAMSEVLIEYFKELSPNISLMNTDGKNPRLLNIQGLQYIHKYS